MKTLLTAIVSATFLFFPITGFAGYIIHLKDGGEIVTDQYYEEEDRIKFKRYGGIIGIEKKSVLKIERTEAPVDLPEKKETTAETEAAPAPDGAKDATKGESSNEKGASAEETPKATQESKSRKESEKDTEKENKELVDKYMKEFDLLKAKMKDVEMMTKEELNTFYMELDTFRKAVLTKRLGGFFAKHLLEVYAMLDKIQTIMHFKGD